MKVVENEWTGDTCSVKNVRKGYDGAEPLDRTNVEEQGIGEGCGYIIHSFGQGPQPA
jgi:hypothetical protein